MIAALDLYLFDIDASHTSTIACCRTSASFSTDLSYIDHLFAVAWHNAHGHHVTPEAQGRADQSETLPASQGHSRIII